jgi:hypothetical protein
MELDVRLPIGFMFSLIGVILLVTGALDSSPLDAWAGSAMLLFSLLCFGLTYRRRAPAVDRLR